jgi:HTH-type transcriptional regulator / antitoxin HigA
MNWSIIQSKKEYEAALKRIEMLSQTPPTLQSEEGRELMLLGFLVDQYEEKEFPIQYPNPIDAIRVRMSDLGLKTNDLIDVFGDRGTASKVLNGQRSLSLAMIRALSEKLSLPVSLLIQPTKQSPSTKSKNKTLQLQEPKGEYRKKKN